MTLASLPVDTNSPAGIRLWLHHATLSAADGTELLGDVCASVEPHELVAIIGASGAGKSTMLDLLAGSVVPTSGHVRVNGVDSHALDHAVRRRIGFVPQSSAPDSLPLGLSLTYAARLRLPSGTTSVDVRRTTRSTLERLHLAESAHIPIDQLSGGQQRRASIAIELLTEPDALLLDEPTSGLDPNTAASLMSELRMLADAGNTVVVTTHHAGDLEQCDRIIALTSTGRVAFDGTLAEAALAAGGSDPRQIHNTLIAADFMHCRALTVPTAADAAGASPNEPRSTVRDSVRDTGSAPSRLVQWSTLTARTIARVRHNRLTMGIMLGAPAAIVAMFAVLFRPGSFGPDAGSVTPAIMIAFWVAFAGFFFGLTYGLLQVCPEVESMRRERRAGVAAGLQILAKMTALGPALIAINALMLVVLRWLDRLPNLSATSLLELWVTLALDAICALALGLLVSALVRTPVQTSLALPMLCFPAVLFAGAMVPIAGMTTAGRAFSLVIPVRWGFDAVGRVLGLPEVTGRWQSDPAGSGSASAWRTTTTGVWVILGAFTLVFTAAAMIALGRRLRPTEERTR